MELLLTVLISLTQHLIYKPLFTGLPRDHPESYHSFMWNNFFKHIDINPENAHILDGNAADTEKECEEYEKKIAAAGGIELFVGGDFIMFYAFCPTRKC